MVAILSGYIVPHPPLIVPAVGGGEEQKINQTIQAYRAVAREIRDQNPDSLVIITPHNVMYQDYLHISPGARAQGDLKQFGDNQNLFRVTYDQDLVQAIGDIAADENFPAGSLGERNKALDHGTLVPLWFLQEAGIEAPMVRISASGLSALEHYHFGKILQEASNRQGKKIVVIASGDLSHRLSDQGPYSYHEAGPQFDREVTQAMASGDFLEFLRFSPSLCDSAGECGLRGFQILAGALDGLAVEPALRSYEGPFGVGYAVASFPVVGFDDARRFDRVYEEEKDHLLKEIREKEDPYVRLARQSLEAYVKDRKKIDPPADLEEELTKKKAGVFVSLKKDGMLRGCMGTLTATEPSVAREIIKNAVSAGAGDPRFDPVEPEELPDIVYSVDVLSPAEAIGGMDELDVKRYGVIVSKGNKRGLLLPDLAGVETPQEQVEIACQKAGIDLEESFDMERFLVVRHK